MIKLASSSNSELVIIPLQDILKLDSKSRMNTQEQLKTIGNGSFYGVIH